MQVAVKQSHVESLGGEHLTTIADAQRVNGKRS